MPSTDRGHEQPDEREAPGATVVQGLIERVTFRAPDSGYTVLRISPERGSGDPAALFSALGERLTAVGRALDAEEGLRVRLLGTWEVHKKHGRQFSFERLTHLPPLEKEGLVRYLSSSRFRGVGETLAARIVEELGTNALAKIRTQPDALDGVPGLRPAVRAALVDAVRSELGAQELYAFLFGLGLGPWQAEVVRKKLGPDAEERLRANPFLLARGIPGIGFQTADRVARGIGLAEDAPERRRAGLVHVLHRAASEGHSLLPAPRLIEEAEHLLALPERRDELGGDLALLAREGEVVVDRTLEPERELVYLPIFHTCEALLARNLAALLKSDPATPMAHAARLEAAEARAEIELHPEQRAAVLGLLSRRVALLTGGPGVGKTTIVRLVVELAEASGARVRLASPTGRAAKRLAEATGREASTIHRLLGFEPQNGAFAHDDRQPLEADLVVVDEVSMLDVVLAHHLLKAVQPPTRLVLVGDPHQLPSVSAGNVLADLLRSERVPTWRLTRIYRQHAESLIVANAHRILAGEAPVLPGSREGGADFFFFPADGEGETATRLVEIVTARIPRRFGMDWVADVQVLSPMYAGECGVDALNQRLRDTLEGIGGELSVHGRLFRVGDRVIHTRNDYEKEVFNGDLGRVLRVAPDGEGLTVRFPERDVHYLREELSDLQPAFAMTVHRSQGGEFRAVVVPLVPRHALMLQRHLLYTAVTRARELVVLVGSRRALAMAVANARENLRESGLAPRLAALLSS